MASALMDSYYFYVLILHELKRLGNCSIKRMQIVSVNWR